MNGSNYTLWMLIMIFMVFPCYFVGAFVLVEDEEIRKRFLIWGAIWGVIIFSVLLYLQMNEEFLFGKDILDAWFENNNELK
ncbi:hypothetical protein CW745_04430 [Psychromonas sp. psych-6C06]|uniref:hypothetical protein n=1 Tax=Psychromonas sp. psych-6C06 TaxID=2058089 RepID=UPI000C344E98|nr:hypothetical protein [Psychromonas sp. psych-6C06]PKF62676.1 hypothetical protein CW745_04430 [Psychromonas sp. psych-6C06]